MEKSLDKKFSVLLHKPPFKEKLFFFASGILSSIPLTMFIEQFGEIFFVNLPQFYAILVPTVIIAPFLEEYAKVFPLFYRHGETVRSIFILGLLVGLGFGIFEFLTYIFILGVPILIRLPGIFFHASSTSITSYGVATKRTTQFYFIAVLLHFSNNFFSFVHFAMNPSSPLGLWTIGLPIVSAATYFLSYRLYNKTSERIVE